MTTITPHSTVLAYYSTPGQFTDLTKHQAQARELSSVLSDLCRVIQGLLLHEHAAPEYGVTLTDERRNEVHIRSVTQMLDRLLTYSDQRLSVARSLDAR